MRTPMHLNLPVLSGQMADPAPSARLREHLSIENGTTQVLALTELFQYAVMGYGLSDQRSPPVMALC
jgi:hypothetical protein